MPIVITPRPPYHSTAARPQWNDLPQRVRELIARRLGGSVAARPSAGSGFTQGFASVITGTGGTQFVKAVNSADSAHIADCYRREAKVNQALPQAVPAPRHRWSEELDGWVILGFDAVESGRMPSSPWRTHELATSLDAYATAAEALSTPPAAFQQVGLKPLGEDGDFDDWRLLAAGTTSATVLPTWVPTGRLDTLAELESRWRQAVAGDAVLHHDLRQDNILVDANGSAWICDWNWPCLGASWFDLVLLLATAHADGHDATTVFRKHPTARGVDSDQLDAALAALSGFFLVSGAQPPADWSPHLRQHQTWCGEVTLRWLAARRKWLL